MKCVMVINKDLPLGLIANTAAVLAVTIGNKNHDMIGEDVLDGSGSTHRGITQAVISILSGDSQLISALRQKLNQVGNDELFYVDFCDVAQRSKKYTEYKDNLANTAGERLNYLGIAIYGPNNRVDKLTGNIPLLK